MRVTAEVATMIRLSKIWPLLLLLLSVCTYNTHSLSLMPPTPPAPPTYFADPTMSTPMTYLPPSYPPFTTPPACTTYDGTVLGIARGEFQMIDCQYCYCDYDGTAYCYYFDCWPAMCVDPVSNGCCSWCPNGNNCLLPSGEILPEGEVRIYENMECQCRNPYDYYNDYYFYYYYYQYDQQAVCIPMPTPPDPCDYATCVPLLCVDALTPPGGCCPECPNGNNCYLPSGEILPEGEIRVYENMACQCRDPYNYEYYYDYYYYNQYDQQAVCYPMPTTPDPCEYATCMPLLCVDAETPPGGCCPECLNGNNCYLPSGEILPEGEIRVYENMVCQCRDPYNDGYYYDYYYYNGQYGQQAMCYPIDTTPNPCDYATCAPLPCVDAVVPPGGCCPECLNGNNCYMPSGEIIPVNELRLFENMLCKCPDEHYFQWREAECFPVSTTPPITSTTPAGCRSWDGQFLDLHPGESRINGCEYCYCSYDGTGYCAFAYVDCMDPPCVDSVISPGGCCPYCPNGPNCRLPSGGILNSGETIEENGMRCSCALNSYTYGLGSLLAECVPSGCRNSDELLDMKPGDFIKNGCVSCFCDWDWTAYCYPMRCPTPSCVDAVLSSDGCCYECPNGNNCYMPSGEIIPVNEIRLFENMLCKCPDELSFSWSENGEAECFPVSTTPPITSTTPAGCRSWDGQFLDLQPGESRINGCEYCYCSYDGTGYCAYADCVVPQCVNAVTSPGGCCAQCPDGPNCQLPSGGILKAGETIDENGMRCSCALNSYSWGLPLAECVPSGCRNWNDELLDMKPGDVVQNGCESCYCDWDGRAYCYSMPCLPPSCLDAVLSSDGCCYECPNGPNCRNWNDELVDMKPGESKQNGCEYCYCDWDGRAYCLYADCMPPPCVDAVLSPDGCCYECPNGPSCLLPSGGTLHAGETIEEGGMTCSCPLDPYNYYYYYWGPVSAMCEPSGCRTMTMDGQLLDLLPGESRANGCEYCSCNPDGVGYCVYSTCSPPTCVDAVVPPGGCCAECLNGNNCLLPSGEILPANEIGWYDNMICQCNSPEYFAQNAICYPFTSPDICSLVTCQPLACQVRVMSPDGCCEVCANGCTLPSGVVIAPGEIRLVDGMLCNCPPETCTPNGKPECFPVTSTPPTTTTSGCRTWDNQFLDLQPGESKTEGCGFCYCDWDGIGYCYYTGACPPPPCVDAEVPPGGCCAECPNGPNCQLPSGEIIPVGESCAHSDLDCTCIFQDGSMVPSLDCRP